MSTYKVVEVLAELSPRQMIDLSNFLLSLGAECREQELILFRQIHKLHSQLPITSKDLSQKVGIISRRLADVANKLLNHVNDFCILLSLTENNDELDRMKAHLDFLIHKRLFKQYASTLKNYLKRLKSRKIMYAPEYLSAYRLYKSIAVHEKLLKGRKISIDIQTLSTYLNAYYRMEQLKLVCESLSRGDILEIQKYNFNYEQIIAETKNAVRQNPLVGIYESLINLFLKKLPLELSEFDSLLHQILILPSENAPHPDIVTVFHFMINLCLAGDKAGLPGFRGRLLDVIEQMEDRDILLERGIISSSIYKAVISVAIKEKRPQLANQFLKKYADYLAGDIRDNVVAFSRAQIAFYEGDYDEVRIQLLEIHRPSLDTLFSLNMRKLDVQLFIEERFKPEKGLVGKKDSDSFEHLIRNFQLYLQRKPKKAMRSLSIDKDVISDGHRLAALNFIKYVSKIATNNANRTILKRLDSQIRVEKKVAERDWLLSLISYMVN